MESTLINTAEDLADIKGTPAHAAFMVRLAGTLWRLEKDDVAKAWRAVPDESTAARFGLTLADFPGTVAPALPVYVPPPSKIPQIVSMRQARLALLGAGLLANVNAAIAGMTGAAGDAARIEWEFATEVQRTSPLIATLATGLALTPAQIDTLFELAVTL
jgi:hypothetical protein